MSFMQPQFVELPNRRKGGESSYRWRLSAPGYMDCTDWTNADTILDAISDCIGMYGDSFDNEDWSIVISELPGDFDEFWRGYLLSLAFTANHRQRADDEPDSLFHNPGGDIADVVDLDELETMLEAHVAELRADCVDFYLEAIKLLDLDTFDRWNDLGSDFHLTRNRHGAGYWDGDWPNIGAQLTELARPYGSCELWVEGNMKIKSNWSIMN